MLHHRTILHLTVFLLLTSIIGGATVAQTVAPSAAAAQNPIVINTEVGGTAIDRRIFGANVPAWLAPNTLTNNTFQQRINDLGPATLLRLPGGSWSNYYDWLACETNNAQTGTTGECYWPWAATPSDFLRLIRDTGQSAIWTVNINGTAQEAAALVAFFNGSVTDTRSIGLDRNGRNWQTVATWAQLRADAGFPNPVPIRLWEVGNEVFGGKPGSGKDCTSYGWEDVWTCDGTEYVNGTANHDGYLAFRAAMRAVDPSIAVGAVGVDDPAGWSNWGNEVIANAGNQLDFYVVHTYAYGGYPLPSPADTLRRPQQIWPDVVTDLNAAFDQYAAGRRAPIAITEYNIFAWQDLDEDNLMRKAVNALFLADTLGQFATQGVTIATQWNMANGQAGNGTDYGLVNADSYARYPQYYALQLWQQFGVSLLPLTTSFDAETTLSLYAGRTADGSITLLAINKTDDPITAPIQLGPTTRQWFGSADVLHTTSLTADSILRNGNPAANNAPPTPINLFSGSTTYTFQPFSVSLLQFEQYARIENPEYLYLPLTEQ
jgi:hypothetical protein